MTTIKERLGSFGEFLAELKPKERELLEECYLYDFVRNAHPTFLKTVELADKEYMVFFLIKLNIKLICLKYSYTCHSHAPTYIQLIEAVLHGLSKEVLKTLQIKENLFLAYITMLHVESKHHMVQLNHFQELVSHVPAILNLLYEKKDEIASNTSNLVHTYSVLFRIMLYQE